MPIQDGALICSNGHRVNQSSIKNTENKTQQPSNCHECGTPNSFKDLIEMVEYFDLNPEDAEN